MTPRLVPAELDVARAVVAGDAPRLVAALRAAGLRPGDGWPHADSADALRPLAEHGPSGGAPGSDGFLVVVGEDVVGDAGWFGPPDPGGDAEIGYGLAPASRGRGLGTAAVRRLVEWVAAQPDVRRVTASVLPGNEPSLRLLRGLGFADVGLDDDGRHLRLALAVTGG